MNKLQKVTLGELILRLQEIQIEHGDELPVHTSADYGEYRIVSLAAVRVEPVNEYNPEFYPVRVMIGCEDEVE